MASPEIHRRSDEKRQEMRQAASARAFLRHQKVREAALIELAKWPAGAAPMAGVLPELVLMALCWRGLAERRYVLTPAGRKEAERLAGGVP